MLETLDYTIRIGSTPTFLYFDLYLYSAYAAHFVYFINNIALKMAKSIGVINKIKSFLSVTTRRTLNYSLVLPYIQYCNIVWANCYTTNLDKILKLQKRVIRIIVNAGYSDHTRPLFLKLKSLNVYEINKLATGSFVY